MKFVKFFLHTLDMSEKMVFSAYKKKTDTGVIEEDKRGTTKCVQIPDKKEIREHIRSFPQTESHYCRKKISSQLLECRTEFRKT